jgi:tyrosyl-tRNA synthetase
LVDFHKAILFEYKITSSSTLQVLKTREVFFFSDFPKNLHFCGLKSDFMPKNFVEELRRRGMLQDIMPETEETLLKEVTAGYVGFDPTADSLHIGSLVPIMLLVHFQRCGHKPIALVGGATGMIGDPSGKSKERNLLSTEQLDANVAGIRAQLAKFLDFETQENPAELVNNYDWMQNFDFLTFLREVGKYITISYMMAKDSVKNRLETGISFTEFSYQLLQGYDFYHLYKEKGCRLQMGGSDQWGNITTGTELIRRKAGGEAFALTCPLMARADGTKFGKSEGGQNIWLDPKRTSPYKFYQFWLNVPDADLPKLIRFFTLFTQEEIESMEAQHATNPNALKRILAEDITCRVHSEEDLQNAVKASALLFGKSTLDDFEFTAEETLQEVFEGVPTRTFSLDSFAEMATTVDLVAEVMAVSKSETRKLIKGGGISINKQKITEAEGNAKPDFHFLKGKYLLLQKGKNYFLVETPHRFS